MDAQFKFENKHCLFHVILYFVKIIKTDFFKLFFYLLRATVVKSKKEIYMNVSNTYDLSAYLKF